MDALVKLVTDKVGISEAQARQAIQVVLGFIKERLPDPLAAQVDKVINTGQSVNMDDVTKNLGGLFGR